MMAEEKSKPPDVITTQENLDSLVTTDKTQELTPSNTENGNPYKKYGRKNNG
jgi:hypothetical protein